MYQQLWTSVDAYFCDLFVQSDPALEAALKASADAGLPPISVAPNQGKLLHLLAKINGSKRILEIGTLGGYSTIWMARALPADGRLVTLEFDPKHAAVARENFARAGLANKIDLRVGKAIESLPKLAAEKAGPFDLIFIDANKSGTPDYFSWAMKLARPGTIIIVDNVVRDGNVIDAKSTDQDIQGIRKFAEMVSKDSRVTATALQTVGMKGYDGLAICVVN
jgi:predicted O-methyltransferase YrrM